MNDPAGTVPAGPVPAGTVPSSEGPAGTPAQFSLPRFARKLSRHRVSLSAGSLAFHWFLSIFPAVIALLGVLGVIRIDAHGIANVTHAVDRALPSGVATVFNQAVLAARKRQEGSVIAVIVGVAVALWSASSGMAALQQALDVAYEVPVDRKFVARRIRSLPLMGATFLLGGAAAALIVLGQPIGSALVGHAPVHGAAFTVLWTLARWAVGLLAISVLFSVYYWVGPNRERPLRWLTPGGALAAAVFLGASVAFSYYVTAFGTYGKTYGTFAGVAILILWLYLTALAILAGGELNAELEGPPSSSGGELKAELEGPTPASSS